MTTNTQSERKSWGDIAIDMATDIAQLSQTNRGAFASLRRMNPSHPNESAFWRLMTKNGLPNISSDLQEKWALIINGIALMTKSDISAHESSKPVGVALFRGDDNSTESAFYSESRFERLLSARGDTRNGMLIRMFRMLGAKNIRFDWSEMAWLILSSSERNRRKLASDYFGCESTSKN